jgi:hypothetical protein
MRGSALALLALVAGGVAGCSGSSSSSRCEGDLADVGNECPATFDGTPDQLPACSNGFAMTFTVRACGDLIRLGISRFVLGSACYYDASTHTLVGAQAWRDIPEFCGDTSLAIYAGRVEPCPSEPLVTKDCGSQP